MLGTKNLRGKCSQSEVCLLNSYKKKKKKKSYSQDSVSLAQLKGWKQGENS